MPQICAEDNVPLNELGIKITFFNSFTSLIYWVYYPIFIGLIKDFRILSIAFLRLIDIFFNNFLLTPLVTIGSITSLLLEYAN